MTINFKAITLEDKPVIDTYLKSCDCGCETSECTFTNLFIWRTPYNVKWAVVKNMLCVTMSWGGETFYLRPFGSSAGIGQTLSAMIRYAEDSGFPFLIKGATARTIDLLEAVCPGQFGFKRDPDNDDYVHLTSDLAELSGRKFSSKKNHINYFQNHYPDYTFLQLTPDTAMRCVSIAYEWYLKKKGNDSFFDFEFQAVKDSLENFAALGLMGGAIQVGSRIEAFSLGEELTRQMVVIHVEKANADMRGAYQLINQQCCQHCWPNYTYVNREEDMGIPGLRKAKQSYHPVKMLEKYDVYLR